MRCAERLGSPIASGTWGLPYNELGEVLASADVGVLPYTDRPLNSARYPNRVGDYLAAGRPVATNLTGDLGNLIRTERVGVTADENPDAFAAAIRDLFEHAHHRQEMGRRARALAETRLSWRAMAQRVQQLYEDLMVVAPGCGRARYA